MSKALEKIAKHQPISRGHLNRKRPGKRLATDLPTGLTADTTDLDVEEETGWIDQAHQVGQTGVTVTPKIYFAIGISGAIQHIVGIKNSGLIIGIKKDKDAPIFQTCHYGIVGDAFEIVPILIEQFKNALSREKVSK